MPLGWGLLALGLYFLWLWYRRMRSALASLKAIKAYGEADWNDLPRIWSSLEQENIALKEQAYREDQLRHSILTNLNVGIVLLGSLRQIVTFNPAAQRLLGSSSRVLFKGTATDLLNDPESLGMMDKAFNGDTSAWSRDRAGRILSFYAVPLSIKTDASAADLGILLAIQDITQQEALEQTRQKFISNASHELKTPVTSIRVAAENLMDDGWIPPEGEGNIKIILRNVDRMTLLLNDISELSRIETGALKLEFISIALEAFLKDVIDNASPLAKYKNVEMSLEIEPCLMDRNFVSDPLRLNQLLENLLSNAIKFSPEKSTVLLSVRLENQWIVFSVRDNGPGISPKDSNRIFERFYRTQTARGVPGTGLGLAIVKHLSRIMGGEVNFESIPCRETTFFVRLPWETPKG
ncbi:MAG: PAS domain-containing sensor histidine kinase [Holophagales bacterium]|jgi:signal transduction histidine kinase|nr:PAS domain-containing sensor histidine kinase [Holophagales bacterium]